MRQSVSPRRQREHGTNGKTQRDIQCIALGSDRTGGQGPSLLEPYGSCSISESISASVPVSSSVSLMLSTAPSVMVTLLVA